MAVEFLISPDPKAADADAVAAFYAGPYPQDRRDSGVNLVTPQDIQVPAQGRAAINFRVRVVLPSGEGRTKAYDLVPRSSIAKTPLIMANSVGIIDEGYRGNLIAKVWNLSKEPYTVKRGASLFQVVSPGREPASCKLAEKGDPLFDPRSTVRGEGGFGSTGA